MPSISHPVRRPGRPPKTSDSPFDTREKLVRLGTEILTEKGFLNTGIDELLKRASVPKGSFYHYFASKEAFGHAVVDNYAAYFARRLDRSLLDERQAPLQRLMNFVRDAKTGMARFDFRRGCLIGNMGQELGAGHEGFRQRLDEVLSDWQARVATCLDAAKAAGQLAPQADSQQLAAFFWIGWEGAVLRAKLVRSDAPLELFATHFFAGLPSDAKAVK
ncbi:MAG: TetR/AcrR family transcriptional regulator [Burkholderiaceae bacterium]|nr:TetR/AcrR family transcriptional regulator [Sulfuritalea sp.]MCF8175339.1 TetR/AcrR family transcriptional regulator [Burkholderiaceae bacterium]